MPIGHNSLSRGHYWSLEEWGILRAYYPDYEALMKKLPLRTKEAIRNAARRAEIPPIKPEWSGEEHRILKKFYLLEDISSLRERLPMRSLYGISAKARSLGLYRGAPKRVKCGVYLIDEIMRRANELNYSIDDLVDATGKKYLKYHYRKCKYVRMDAVEAAIQEMGGRILIVWDD